MSTAVENFQVNGLDGNLIICFYFQWGYVFSSFEKSAKGVWNIRVVVSFFFLPRIVMPSIW